MSLTLNLQSKKILVIGDLMLDRYIIGPTTRISPEAPVPIVKAESTQERLGGAANVALNLAALGCSVTLLGAVGFDEAAQIIKQKLIQDNIQHELLVVKDFNTTVKLRVLSQNQQLLRVDSENFLPASASLQLVEIIEKHLVEVDLVVLSDYNKGVLQHAPELIDLIKKYNLPIVVDPKQADMQVYAGVTLLKPNLHEFSKFVGNCDDLPERIKRACELRHQLNLESLVLTMGSAGILVVTKDAHSLIPAKKTDVYDVTGAGDTVCALFAMGIANKLDLAVIARIASVAASLVIKKVGTASVTMLELSSALAVEGVGLSEELLTTQQVLQQINIAKQQGEKVVFVNGCYDILHIGHINYLTRAKALGDRLVVAINADEYVKRTKGTNRPINTQENRMKLLLALKVVDWVVVFYENSPGAIVEYLTPDILVKNTQYYSHLDQVPATEGAAHVLQHGGSLALLEHTAGISSSQIASRA